MEDGCQIPGGGFHNQSINIYLFIYWGVGKVSGERTAATTVKGWAYQEEASQAISQSSAPPDLGTVSVTGDSCCRQPCGETACCVDSSGITLNGLVCPPGLRKGYKGHGAFCVSLCEIAVGAVLCRD